VIAQSCPLCATSNPAPIAPLHGRLYHDCTACGLVFMDAAHHPGPAAERAHYDTHENDAADPGYRRFLDRLAKPLAGLLAPGAEGLDYGCGPAPALAAMLTEYGFRVSAYDPFFAPDPVPLQRRYDFVTCTEAAEHFHRPAREFARLDSLLRFGGRLGLMTELLRPDTVLGRWRYARDPTHVCFYRERTLRWLATRFGWEVEYWEGDVVVFRRRAAAGGGRGWARRGGELSSRGARR
jgi:hypothetical protein